MGWEDQGRQYHGWFGSGTSAQAEMTPAQVAETVARGAARALAPGMQREFVAFTSRDQGQRLTEAIGIWTQAAHLPPSDFHAKVVGSAMSKEAATLLQAMARDLATASGPESLGAASMNLAAALASSGKEDLVYRLAWAQDQALYAAEQGLVPDAPVLPVAASVAAAGGIPAVSSPAAPSVMTGLQALRLLLGLPTAALVGLGILLWPKPAGDIYRAESTPPTNKPGKGETPEDRRTGTHDRPPTGSMPINETPWSGDHGTIKDDLGLGGTDNVKISPDGDVWIEHPDGSWSNEGRHRASSQLDGRRGGPEKIERGTDVMEIDVTDDIEAPAYRFFLALKLTHPSIAHEAISEALRVEPTGGWTVGLPRETRTGTPLEGNYEQTYWYVSEKTEGSRQFLDACMEFIDYYVEPHIDFVSEFITSGGSATLSISLAGGVNIGDDLSPANLQRLGKLGLGLTVEVFPVLNG